MATHAPETTPLHGPGLLVELTSDRDGECLLEMTQADPTSGDWRLEVIWQPVDEIKHPHRSGTE